MSAYSHLYVPGNVPDRFPKALASGAGAVVVDLEDAVAPHAKDAARATVAEWLRQPRDPGVEVWVRVNEGQRGVDDVRAVLTAGLTGICVPKVDDVSRLAELDAVLAEAEAAAGLPAGQVQLSPLIETAVGLLAAVQIAGGPRVRHLQLGEVDLAADLGVDPGPDGTELLYARSAVVVASRAAGIDPPLAPVSTEFRDLEAFAAQTRALTRMGFLGRACIHPAQVRVVEELCRPSAEELAAARDVLDRLAAAGTGLALDADGRMLDEAVARAARRLVARSTP